MLVLPVVLRPAKAGQRESILISAEVSQGLGYSLAIAREVASNRLVNGPVETAAIWRISSARTMNSSGRRDCMPSERPFRLVNELQ